MKFKNFKSILVRHAHLPVSKNNVILETMQDYYEPADKPMKLRLNRKMILSAVTAFLFLAMVSFASVLEYTPTESLTLDINPGFEVQLNRFGRVVKVEGYGDEAEAILSDLKLGSRSFDLVMDNLVLACQDAGIAINPDSVLLISLSNQNNTTLVSSLEQWSLNTQLTLFYVAPGSLIQDSLEVVMNNKTNYFIKSTSGIIDYTVSSIPTYSDSGIQTGNESYEYPATNTDGLINDQVAQGYFLLDQEDLETASLQLQITQARLQLIIAIYNGYEEYDTRAEFQTLIDLPLNELVTLYEAIPE